MARSASSQEHQVALARFAKVLSAAGAKVVVARRQDRLEELVGELPDAIAIR